MSVLARNPHKGPEDEISLETTRGGGKECPREDRETQLPKEGEETSRLEIAVQGMTQSAEGGNEKMEVGLRRESTEVRKVTAKTC